MSELTLALARSQQPVQQPHDLILAQQYGLTPETDFEKYMNLSASIPMPSMPQLPTGSVYIVELLASFYGELVYLNRLNSLTGCAVDSRETIGNVSKLFDDINAGAGMETYASDGMQIGFSVLQTVGDCQGASWAEVSAQRKVSVPDSSRPSVCWSQTTSTAPSQSSLSAPPQLSTPESSEPEPGQ